MIPSHMQADADIRDRGKKIGRIMSDKIIPRTNVPNKTVILKIAVVFFFFIKQIAPFNPSINIENVIAVKIKYSKFELNKNIKRISTITDAHVIGLIQ